MELKDETAVIFHLRMTGQLRLQSPSKQDRAAFLMDDDSHLCFLDRRRFGEMFYSNHWWDEPIFQALGPEPLNGRMNGETLKGILRGRSAPIHSILLNQKIISGLGNIYVTESLFHAGISPSRAAGRIPIEKLEGLCKAMKEVLEKSILNRGYSMHTYVDALGRKGRSQMFTVVYGKDEQPCIACGVTLKRKVITGRGVVYCPKCQK